MLCYRLRIAATYCVVACCVRPTMCGAAASEEVMKAKNTLRYFTPSFFPRGFCTGVLLTGKVSDLNVAYAPQE